MKPRDWLFWVLVAIAVITVFSGLFQIVAPGVELHLLVVENTSVGAQLFATIGMFMVLFGGLFLHVLFASTVQPAAALWCGLQKFGASIAVGIGVLHHIFSPLALLVAAFDFCSGILAIWFWLRISRTP